MKLFSTPVVVTHGLNAIAEPIPEVWNQSEHDAANMSNNSLAYTKINPVFTLSCEYIKPDTNTMRMYVLKHKKVFKGQR